MLLHPSNCVRASEENAGPPRVPPGVGLKRISPARPPSGGRCFLCAERSRGQAHLIHQACTLRRIPGASPCRTLPCSCQVCRAVQKSVQPEKQRFGKTLTPWQTRHLSHLRTIYKRRPTTLARARVALEHYRLSRSHRSRTCLSARARPEQLFDIKLSDGVRSMG